MQGYTVDEAVRLTMAHHAINIIPMSENGYDSYAEVLFTSPTLIASHPMNWSASCAPLGRAGPGQPPTRTRQRG